MSYKASDFLTTNKSLGIGQGVPTDARSYFYDRNSGFPPRPFQSRQEVIDFFPVAKNREGYTSVYINLTGTVDGATGHMVGGKVTEWWWRDNVTDDGLVPRWQGQNVEILVNPTSWTAEAGTVVDLFIIEPNVTTTFSMGKSPDGNGYVDNETIDVTSADPFYILSRITYYKNTTTVLFSGLGNATVKIFKRL